VSTPTAAGGAGNTPARRRSLTKSARQTFPGGLAEGRTVKDAAALTGFDRSRFYELHRQDAGLRRSGRP
jgi:hypothetical protein